MQHVSRWLPFLALVLGLGSFQGCNTDTDPAEDALVVPAENTPTVNIVEIKGTGTWQSLFIKNSSEIPSNEFKAFYFEDSTNSITAFSERVPFPNLSFSKASPQGISAKRFNAYWIGKFEFPEKATWRIDLSQSNAFARILIDSREIYSGRVSRSLSHAFAKGDHIIEIEYKNDWDTVGFTMHFTPTVPTGDETPPGTIDTAITGVEYWYAGAYESGNNNSSLNVVLKKSDKPVVLFLSSYRAVYWNITPAYSGQVLAVYVDSYEPQSTVTGLGSSVLVTTLKGIPFSYKLLPECHPEVGYCDDPGFQKLITFLGNESKVLTGYTGAYNPASMSLPEVILNEAKYKEIKDQTQALIDSSKLRLLGDVFRGDTAATWQSHFISSDSIIPVGKFQAFYFSDKKPDTVLHSEITAAPGMKYSWSDLYKLDANNFAGYWIGTFEFTVPTVLNIGIKQSHAQTAIYINKRSVLTGPEDISGMVALPVGKHLIEIQHINNWHTIDFFVSLVPR